mgnify:CR=1 FL=1
MYKQYQLPYAYGALEPHIDALTMETHYSKHHAAYTKNLNDAAEKAGVAGREITELLANLEGLERGPAGNTSLAAAFCLAQELPEDQILVVSETEYTGAGKHVQPQLDFARENGIEVRFGKPGEEVPGVSVILPADPYQFQVRDLDLDKMRHSLIKTALKTYTATPTEADYEFLAQETNKSLDWVREQVAAIVPTL